MSHFQNYESVRDGFTTGLFGADGPTTPRSPEHVLWVRVLAQAVSDALRDPKDGETWVGRYPTADFMELCSLAGFDGHFIWRGMRNLLDTKDKKEFAERALVVKSMFYTNNRAGQRGVPKGVVRDQSNGRFSMSAAPTPEGEDLDHAADTTNCNPHTGKE